MIPGEICSLDQYRCSLALTCLDLAVFEIVGSIMIDAIGHSLFELEEDIIRLDKDQCLLSGRKWAVTVQLDTHPLKF